MQFYKNSEKEKEHCKEFSCTHHSALKAGNIYQFGSPVFSTIVLVPTLT